MKRLNIILMFLAILYVSCKKDKEVFISSSSVNVVNMALDAGTLKVNPAAGSAFSFGKTSETIAYGANRYYSSLLGERMFQIVSSSDTTKSFFSGVLNLDNRINSLYLIGQSPSVETLFVPEVTLPLIQTDVAKPDSSVYIRFANFSPNSPELKINIRSNGVNEVSDLVYKRISTFKKYDAKVTTVSYIFEIRDVLTNTVQFTYTFNPNNNRYKTLSLILKGSYGSSSGTNAFGVSQVNYN